MYTQALFSHKGEMISITTFKFRRPDLNVQRFWNVGVTDLNRQAYSQTEEDSRSFLDDSTKRVNNEVR
jgi:hypothetical protein